MSYASGIFVKPELYTEEQKYPKDKSAILSEKKIKKREAQLEK